MPRIRYSQETKQQAVRLVLEEHVTLADAAKQIGCNPITVQKWVRQSQIIATSSCNRFIPIQIVENNSVDLVLPNGITLKISNVSPEFLAVLFKNLASC